MPTKKKKFIDKKHAVTFQLIHRSQRDPLVTDEKAPKRILQPIIKKDTAELEKYGIYFDDDYDYMQHLKAVSEGSALVKVEPPIKEKKENTKISLPSSVFASHVEEKVGLLNQAAPKSGLDLTLDPDVIAALDSDYDYDDSENEFEDDFVMKLNAPRISDDGSCTEGEGDEGEEQDKEDEVEEDEESEQNSSHISYSDEEFETKSRFTEYSMTSSVIRRNDQLTFLDDRFEQMFSEYDDTEIGALECEEIEGYLDDRNDILLKFADDFEKTKQKGELDIERTEILSGTSSESEEHSLVEVKQKEKWDCESILSTYSNIYNHPKLIEAPPSKIRINPKTGIPETKTRLTAKALAALNEGESPKCTGPRSLASMVSLLSIRPKGEQPEERKSRKKAFRQHKKERRMEKKLNTEAFKEEKKRMENMIAHNKCISSKVYVIK